MVARSSRDFDCCWLLPAALRRVALGFAPPPHGEDLVQDFLKGHLALPSCIALCGVDNTVATGDLVIDGDGELSAAFDRWLRGG